jgi:iron complex outermembrane receptor protein
MSNKKRQLCTAIAAAVGASVTLSMVAGEAAAQQSPQNKERIEVTGSNIKRTDTETPSPVQVITKEQIERAGVTSVAELLRQVPAIAGGSIQDFNGGSGFQAGNQTASLRGLGSVATLVLLNGRRVAPAPNADPNTGQGSSFNLNTIPFSAIERIEILKDGASAVYGSEAIAGVINIILRKDYRGAEVSVDHWQKSDGGYEVNQASAAAGFGDLARDRYNFLIAGEWFKREPQRLQESGSGVQNEVYRTLANRLNAANAVSYPGNVRRESSPGSGVFLASGRLPVDSRCPPELRVTVVASTGMQECRYNLFDNQNIFAELERKSFMGRATFQVASNLTAFAEASFTRNDTTFPGNPPGLDAVAPSTWFNVAGDRFGYTLILPVGHPDNPNNFRIGLRYRFGDIGRTERKVRIDATRAVAGLNGTFGAWDWESAVLYTTNKRTDTRNDVLHFPTLLAAVNSGSYRFSGSNSQSLLDALHPVLANGGESKIASWDLKASRELMQMRSGPMALAAGVEARREEMDIFSDSRTVAGEMLGLASSNVKGSRNVGTVYGELSIPLLKNLETQVAARYDHYSDFGNSFVPKVGFKWLATDTLAARGTWAKGFRAPSLFQISNANVQAFQQGIVDPLRCPNPPTPAPGGETEDCNRTISILFNANTKLEPEKSVSHTLGLIWSPTNSFQASLDYWFIHRTNFIDLFQTSTILQNESNPNFRGGTVIRNPNPASWLPGIPNSGPIQSTISRFENFGDQVAAGWDFDMNYRFALGAWGRLTLEANATYYDKNDWQLDKGVNYVGGAGNFYAFESPRVKGVLTGVWDIQSFSFLARYNYTGRWYYGDPTGSTPGGADNGNCYLSSTGATLRFLGECYVKAWETYDLGVSWKGIRNLTISGLVRNVRDTPAPYDPNQTTLGFNPRFHNPYGRYFQVGFNYKFK